MRSEWLLANLSWRTLAYNFAVNSGLYLFYCLVPHSDLLQRINRDVFWRFFWL